ncbi:hypothetical protein KDK95_17675 [Actinospica sp. MGRD01-02]|uniref:Uncharacterized protein n=1 Tax=Actinospica acidithermotolerans TaxID=2828514 RepID=A0A941EAU5_9ACTN|nr:hypothetical protein [Actinospica acidithermotolerans]MBR7828151.1 hypothetical protein [Actinospica acidithermotolerans]
MASRLETRSAQLSQLIEAADAEPQRRIAVRAAKAAVSAVALDEPELAPALADLALGRWGGPGAQAATALTDRLDAQAWGIHDEMEQGTAEQVEYRATFRRARAASAVAFALATDPRNAALEAAYEADAAIENLELIRGIVNEVLGIEQDAERA